MNRVRTRVGNSLVRFLAGVLVWCSCAAGATRAAELPPPPGMAGRLIAHFKMQRIPEEGAWFAVSYSSDDRLDGAALPSRYAGHAHAAGGAIVVVVTARDFSALHRLKTDEVWHFYGGAPLRLLLLYPDGKGRSVTLGGDVLRGGLAQFTVPAGVWQGAAPIGDAGSYSFVGTQMSPAFDAADFEIGHRDELRRRYPALANSIVRLTRVEFAAGRPLSRPDMPGPGDALGAERAAATPARAFVAGDVPPVEASPGVSLQELVGRVAPSAQTSALSIAKFTLSPGRSTGTSFNHHSQEVFLVVDGSGEVHLRDSVTAVKVDSTVFIPAGEPHSIQAALGSTLTFYAVSAPAFSPEDYELVAP